MILLGAIRWVTTNIRWHSAKLSQTSQVLTPPYMRLIILVIRARREGCQIVALVIYITITRYICILLCVSNVQEVFKRVRHCRNWIVIENGR